MNRYTFKAKRKDNGEWVYGSFCGFYPFCNEETKIFADECKIISNKFDKEVEYNGFRNNK